MHFFFFGGLLYFRSGFLDARAVFRIVMERVDILIAINFHLHSNFTVQMARLGDSLPLNQRTPTYVSHSSSSNSLVLQSPNPNPNRSSSPSSLRGVRLNNVEILS